MSERTRAAGGFSLVEVALALGLAAFCLVAVFGLLPVGVNTNRGSIEQSAAAGIAATLASDLRNATLPDPLADQTSPYYQLTIPATPAGTVTHFIFLRRDGSPATSLTTSAQDQPLDPAQNPHYRATLSYTMTGAAGTGSGTVPKNPVAARILISWPPQLDPAAVSLAGSFEVLTTVPRN